MSEAEAARRRGDVLRDLGRFDEARAAYDQAIALGDGIRAPVDKARLLMLLGDHEQGLPLYETRWRSPEAGIAAPLDPALWGGRAKLGGKSILLRAEQGPGDTLQMLRYAPILAQARARVVLQVQAPLLTLARTAPGVAAALTLGEPAPKTDLVCPMMSLPLLLGRRFDTPGPSAYLQASHERWETWEARLGPRRRRRIGLAWSDAEDNGGLALAALEPLLWADVDFVSLQMDHPPADAIFMDASGRVRDLSDGLLDFADMAGLVAALDLVIAVDTAAAHLAGALGKPVWLLLPFTPDFRWGLGRIESPVYPSARLFRQPRPGDWDAAVGEVVRALA